MKNFSEQFLSFFKRGGHNHDGINSTPIDITKYDDSDFGPLQSRILENINIPVNVDFPTGVTIGTTYIFDAVPPPTGLILSTGENFVNYEQVWVKATWTAPAVEDGIEDIDNDNFDDASPPAYGDQAIEYEVTIYPTSSPGEENVQRTKNTYITFQPLEPVVEYTVEVRSVSQLGVKSDAITDTITSSVDTTAPGQVTGVSLSSGFKTALLSWAANTEADVKNSRGKYDIEFDTANTFDTGNLRQEENTGTVVSFSDLTTGTTYYARVRAVDSSGNQGTWSATVNTTPGQIGSGDFDPNDLTDGSAPSSAVTGLTVFGGPTYFTLQWTDITNADQVIYDVHVGASAGFTPGAGNRLSTSNGKSAIVRDSSLAYGTTYYFKVIARDADGSGPATSAVSAAMAQITATDIGPNSITTGMIQSNQIVTSHLDAGNIDANVLKAGTIIAGSFEVDAIRTADIKADQINVNHMKTDSVDTNQLVAGAVTTDELDVNSVTAGKLAAITMEVAKYIESDDWDGLGNGWRIDGAGNAEFNDVIARGSIEATEFKAVPSAENYVTNGKFETNTAGWAAEGDASIATSVTYASEGTQSMKITEGTTNPAYAISDYIAIEDKLAYTVTLNGGPTASSIEDFHEFGGIIQIEFYNAASTLLDTRDIRNETKVYPTESTAGSGGLALRTGGGQSAYAPTGTTKCKIRLGSGHLTDVYVDEVGLFQVPTISDGILKTGGLQLGGTAGDSFDTYSWGSGMNLDPGPGWNPAIIALTGNPDGGAPYEAALSLHGPKHPTANSRPLINLSSGEATGSVEIDNIRIQSDEITLAGNVDVSGASDTLYVRGQRIAPAYHVDTYRSSQSVGSGETVIGLNAEYEDLDGMHSISSNTQTIKIPNTDAADDLLWNIQMECSWSGSGTGRRICGIRIDTSGTGTAFGATKWGTVSFGDGSSCHAQLSRTYKLPKGTWVDFRTYSADASQTLAARVTFTSVGSAR